MSFILIDIFCAVVVISSMSATALFTILKWRIDELYDLHVKGRRVLKIRIGELCFFCLGFWIGLVLTFVFYLQFRLDELIFITPFATASLTKYIYEGAKTKG
jgi:uncharacterized membrane protein